MRPYNFKFNILYFSNIENEIFTELFNLHPENSLSNFEKESQFLQRTNKRLYIQDFKCEAQGYIILTFDYSGISTIFF